MTGWVDSVLKYCDVASLLKSSAPGKTQSTGSVDRLVPDGVRCAAGRHWQLRQLDMLLLLLLSCRCPACAEPTAGNVRALLILSSAGYRSPRRRLLTLSLEQVKGFLTVLFEALLCFFTPAKANVCVGKMVLHMQRATSVGHCQICMCWKQFIHFPSEKHATAALTSARPLSASAPSICRAFAWLLKWLSLKA